MCLIAFAIGQSPEFPLVVAANRDEFFRRPTAAMDWWQDNSGQQILAGQDLESGGTWLAVNTDGTLMYSFVQGVEVSWPGYVVRMIGGMVFLSGMFLMAYNVWMTIRSEQKTSAADTAAQPA